MRQITPSNQKKSKPKIIISVGDNKYKKDFPPPFNHIIPKEAISQEDILQYENYILEELNDLKKKFNEIHSDILFLKTITSDALRTNKSYLALEELFLKTQQQQREIEELTKFFQNLRDKKNFIFENYLRKFDDLVNSYKIQLQQDKANFEELSKEIKKINELMDVAEKIKRSRVKKEEIASTKSLTTKDKNDKDSENYSFDFFLKIKKSREKLDKLKSEYEAFCNDKSYLGLIQLKDLDEDKFKRKIQLIISVRDYQYKILQNLEIINSYQSQFQELSISPQLPLTTEQKNLTISELDSFCDKLHEFLNSNSLDKFKAELRSLLKNKDKIIILKQRLYPIPEESNETDDSSSLTDDSQQIKTINPIKLFQEVLKNLLDENQQSTNSIKVFKQELSSNCSLFQKLKCFSSKVVDEDDQPTISYFLIGNKLVKLTYNSQDLGDSSEANSGNLDHHNEEQFTKFSSAEILEKLDELKKLKLISSLAFDRQDSSQNPSSQLSQNFLNNFKIEIIEIDDLNKNQSIPKSIKKEVDKFKKSTPNISASIGCFQPLDRGSERQVAL